MPRTIESLQQVIHGLYPTDKSAAAAYNPTLEHLDARLSKYLDGQPVRVDGKPRASGIMDTVSTPTPILQMMSLDGIYRQVRAAIAHGIKVPPEFEDKAVVDVIERAVVNEWFAVLGAHLSFGDLDKTEEVRRLGMGRLLDDMTRKMQHKVDNGTQDPLKILVHSTHDTALAALCSTLDVFDDQ
ncbi:hypothetical protein H0H81_000107 [Sphagnurus paluster]|uniref:Uncharacterized protein n=1 Tax=Sphagnurus paluster TaxID=117069 RepID=A0A9P7GXC5_9AGAR|nr:hypothetical protein H0H81_000107 [Sphagnurus paluster]